MSYLILAVRFLTIVPVPGREAAGPEALGRAAWWFPAVGLALGACLVAADQLFAVVFPPLLGSILLVSLWKILTGGIHLDGLADVLDGLSGRDADRRLAIMRDSHIGVFGAAGLVLFVLLTAGALDALPPGRHPAALLLAPAVGRLAPLLIGPLFPAAAPGQGTGASFLEGLSPWAAPVSIVGLWAGSIYVPTAVTQIARAEGYAAADAARIASYGSMVLSIATIIGCLAAPWMAERFGRRLAMSVYFVVLGVAVAIAFGYVFYTPSALSPFFVLIFFLGIGGANFALYTLWLPEQYATNCRASAIAFVSSIGRFFGVAMVFLVGTAIQRYGSLGVPVAVTAVAFVVGLLILPFAVETRGKALPR